MATTPADDEAKSALESDKKSKKDVASSSEVTETPSENKKKKKDKKDQKKGKRKKKAGPITPPKPQYTEEDIQRYIQKRDRERKLAREKKLVEFLKSLVLIVSPNDRRWTQWNIAPLYRFIRNPNIHVVTIFFRKLEVHKEEKKLLWADEDDLHQEAAPEKTEDEEASPSQPLKATPSAKKGAMKSEKAAKFQTVRADPMKRPDVIDGERLVVTNSIIPNKSLDMFYFIKIKGEVVSRENFYDVCLFGNLSGGYLPSLQSFMNNVITPIFHFPSMLPESVKNDFRGNLNNFMSAVTETHHRLRSHTVLYVPTEALTSPIDVASKNKELCSRLESSMVHWIRQIKEVLNNQNMQDTEDWAGPMEEIAFWDARCQDLSGLTTQIRSQAVRTVKEIMTIIKSPFVHQFSEASSGILEAHAEALSNLHYLGILIQPCEKFAESKVAEMPDQLQNLLWLVRVIWLNAPFYTTKDRLNGLLRKISNQLILHCIREIDVDRVFSGYIESSEKLIDVCLNCIKRWREKYFEAQKMHNMHSHLPWLLEYDSIFSHVAAFAHRLRDLLEICICQRLYGRRVEGYQEPLPLYPGTRASEMTRIMKEIQKMLDRQLRNLYGVRQLILDVKNTAWHEHMATFRNSVKDMEIMIENVLFSAFESVTNVEQGIQILETFYVYYQRDIITRAYDKLIMKLYKIFEDDMNQVRTLYSKNILPLPVAYTQYAGRAAWSHYLKRRLHEQMKLLNLAWWLPNCGYGDDVKEQALVLMKTLIDFSAQMHVEWVKIVGNKELSNRLEIPLMIRSTYKAGMIEVNFDKVLYRHIAEAEMWTRMSQEIPEVLLGVYHQRERLHMLRETVLLVVKDYNRIISALSPEERSLFRERIKTLERKVYPGLTKLTWVSDVSDAYINDCRQAASKVQGYTNDYKDANIKIGNLAVKISNILMVKIDPKRLFKGMEFEAFQTLHREKAVMKIANEYRNITTILRTVFEMFKSDGPEVKTEWMKYLNVIDSVVEEAFCINIKRSLELLSRAVHGDIRGPPPPIIQLDIILDVNRLGFFPSIDQMKDMVLGIYRDICITIQPFPRVVQFLSDPTLKVKSFSKAMSRDEKARQTYAHIGEGINQTVQDIERYLSTWEPYRDVWEVDKNVFIKKYEELDPPVSSYDTDIGRYSDISDAVTGQESVITMGFCIIDCGLLKSTIADHCRLWQKKLSNLLYSKASKKLMGIYKLIEDNIARFVDPPETLPDLVTAVNFFSDIQMEAPKMERTFPLLFEQFAVLSKYEFELGNQIKMKFAIFPKEWENYLSKLKEIEQMLKKAKDKLKLVFLAMADAFNNRVKDLLYRFKTDGPFTGEFESENAIELLANFRQTMYDLQKDEQDLLGSLAIFEIDMPPNQDLRNFEIELKVLDGVWELVAEWDGYWYEYSQEPFRTMQTTDMEDIASTMQKKFVKMSNELQKKNWPIILFTKNRVDVFKRSIPVIHEMKNTAIRERHWSQIFDTIGFTFDPQDSDFNFETIVSYGMEKYAEEIGEISAAAQKELIVENTVKAISEAWTDQKLDMSPYKLKGHFRLKTVQDMMQNLEDHTVSISALKGSRYAKPFEEEINYWEKTLSQVTYVLDAFLNVQRQWIYLENIFAGEDIRKQLPKETRHFDEIDRIWMKVTSDMASDLYAIKATHREGLSPILQDLSERLESILKSLEIFLEAKRQAFPRFYFISNDDLLEILGNSKNPELVQPHLKKLFDNIHKIRLAKIGNRQECSAMISGDGETIDFTKAFMIEGAVESWLTEIESNMRVTLKNILKKTKDDLRKNLNRRDKWIMEWPGQTGLTASQIQWTIAVTRALYAATTLQMKQNPLKKVKKKLNKILQKFSTAIRGQLTKMNRLKITAMVTVEIHARDVTEHMYKVNCRDLNGFEWLQQLRFYWDRDENDCVIRQTNTYFLYAYEYLGNSGRLVITPLSERCYVTLTTALFLHRGGSPKGPAGTGKTETTKDLGKNLGMYVIVINCSEGLDYKSMGKMFSGLAQTGAWGCFDEFNRINIEVLSVVAQQITSILQAKGQGLKTFFFEGYDIKLIWSCGIFITMNPGYAGRTELPDNLKAMFRPIAMIVPDCSLIAEIVLFGEGFQDVRILARKVDTLYSLAKQQLSRQDHYDFGLRSMVALLRYAGQKRRVTKAMSDPEVLILAMRDMNIPRLTSDDVPLFNGVIRDLFPAVEPPTFDYGSLQKAIEETLRVGGYQVTKKSVLKVLELYETKSSRHSVMIVGRTGSGKSVTWKTLRDAVTMLARSNVQGFFPAKEYVINPKALNLAELYGEFDLSTGEWADGVISSIMRTICADEKPDLKWIMFDGPVDAVWIENMNSVMDDNKILTLINSERISMPEQVSLLFEVDTLAQASPATVSRCGMVYNDFRDLGWKPYIESWLERQKKEKVMKEYRKNIDAYLSLTLQHKAANCKELVKTTELNLVTSLTKLMDSLATKENGVNPKDDNTFDLMVRYFFIFSLIWSVCCTIDEEGRKKMDAFLRELDPVFPAKDTIYDYYVDTTARTFTHWDSLLPTSWFYDPETPFFQLVVPTVDTVRYNFLTTTLLRNSFPVLATGPVGTGKTSIIQSVLTSLDEIKYSVLVINMSSQTTSCNVQNFMESRLEKRAKGLLAPPRGKSLITFMDDLNMPAKDIYGSQPPLELLRQWLDYKFWYDRENQTPKVISNMFLVAAMGPPGGGRTEISPRLKSCFSIINMTFPEEPQVKRIFVSLLAQKLKPFEPEVKVLSEPITNATIDVYNAVSNKMLPTPTKIHYLFNLRDISKVYQGLLRSSKDKQENKIAFSKLWFHECIRVFHDRLVDEADREWFIACLADKLGVHLDQTLQSVCPNRIMPIFGDFITGGEIYEDFKDFKVLRKFFEEHALPKYNSTPGTVPMKLVLFRDAIEHVARIARVISQPKGNMMVVGIGGHGRQSLSRLASSICGYGIFEIEVNKRYGKGEFREDLKKVYRRAGCDNKSCTFLMNDTQIVNESFVEDLNNVLSSGEVPNLYKTDEFEEIKGLLTRSAVRAGYQENNEGIFKFMLERVQSNLHVILCMSPIGNSFRHRVRQYPALVNGTTIDWFERWPKQALLEVAQQWLQGVVLDDRSAVLQDEMRDKCSSMFASIHFSVSNYCTVMLEEMKRHNYVTPINYLELVAGYKVLLAEKRKYLGDSASRLKNGLDKIIDTRAKVEDMTVEMESAQRRVLEYQGECDATLEQITKQKTETDVQAVVVSRRREQVAVEEKECIEMARIAYAELSEALPALDEANEALRSLNKKDIGEVKSYASPPILVAKVMEAVMVLKQIEPTWAEAKKQLGNADFLKELQEFDKDNISNKTITKLAKYIADKDFIPDIVGKVSTAAKTLCIWVRAMELYAKIYNAQVAPKKAKLMQAEAILEEKQRILQQQEEKIRILQEKLDALQKSYKEKMELKEELERKADIFRKNLERAAMLVEGLAGERVRWEQTIKFLEEQLSYVVGDCLIAAACVSYVGPFTSEYRIEMMEEWSYEMRSLRIPCSSEYSFTEFLANPTKVRMWNIQGLPRDVFSTENGVIVTRGRRTPLMIDPQSQALKWIKNMETQNGLKVLDQRQPNYLSIMEVCISQGQPVLIKDVGEEIDQMLWPILSRATVTVGGRQVIKIGDKEIEFSPDFRFYITTKLSNPHYIPEIASRACIVNFTVKEQGLESQLLGIVVRKEKPELEEMKDTLVINIAAGKKKLEELEEMILRLLNESTGSILEDEELAITLKFSKETSDAVTKQVAAAQETEIEIDASREHYRSSARRASILFFVVYDMSRIDPMYQFSLDAYINLFNWSIDKSPKSTNLDARIEGLNDFHTYAVYRNICRGLFEKHKLLFSFHMCAKIMDEAGLLNSDEYQFFLKGGIVVDRSEQMDNPCEAWLSEIAWDNITEMDKFSSFRGLVASFEQNPDEWYEWYTSTEPENEPLPVEWDQKLNDFQKLVVVRALRSDRVSFRATSFVATNIGKRFTEPPVLDMNQVLNESSAITPLIFVLSPGADPAAGLYTLAENHRMVSRFFSLSLGQGQAPIATRMIEEGSKLGQWIFLANCHLSLSWMPQLDKLIENIMEGGPHHEFRLWLSSSPHPDFPLPILQAGIKMTTEPPKGIKANMKRMYQNMPKNRFQIVAKPEKYKKLLFALCFFHSILLERKKFQQLGWNIVYGFNDSDYEVSEMLLGIYLTEYDDTPWDALKYLIAGVMYGGHVTDDFDRRLLLSYIDQYFCEDTLMEPFYRLSSLSTYYIPRDGELPHYKDVISKFPNMDHPEAFGQHPNADIASQISEAELLFSTLLSLQVQKQAAKSAERPEDQVARIGAEIMEKLPPLIDEAETRKQLQDALHHPLNIVLIQEISRYNVLLEKIKISLIELDKGIKGLVVMSSELEEIFQCIQEARVPPTWLKSYASLKPLGSWTRDLVLRMDQLSTWQSTLTPPVKFWLSGFTFPTGFLTAVLQTAARKYSISIDTLSWDFAVSTVEAANIVLPPKDGVYVQGLYLEGASWDKKNHVLVESAPMQLVNSLPVILFKPVESKKRLFTVYEAPCYYYPIRAGNYVVTVELRCSQDTNPNHWVQRGVALLMSLAI